MGMQQPMQQYGMPQQQYGMPMQAQMPYGQQVPTALSLLQHNTSVQVNKFLIYL